MCSLDHPGNYPGYLGILGYLDRKEGSVQCVPWTIPGITLGTWESWDTWTGRKVVCIVFPGPSRELSWVLGNPRILGQEGRLVCSVFPGPSWELPWVLGNLGILGEGVD